MVSDHSDTFVCSTSSEENHFWAPTTASCWGRLRRRHWGSREWRHRVRWGGRSRWEMTLIGSGWILVLRTLLLGHLIKWSRRLRWHFYNWSVLNPAQAGDGCNSRDTNTDKPLRQLAKKANWPYPKRLSKTYNVRLTYKLKLTHLQLFLTSNKLITIYSHYNWPKYYEHTSCKPTRHNIHDANDTIWQITHYSLMANGIFLE